ncbi:MAG TPA: MFS transporter [Jatrophihabitans sp.]|nr:MFS transporter [Jatrophihabitans sp.]
MTETAVWAGRPVERVQRRTVRTLALCQAVGALGLGTLPSVGILLAQQVTHSDVWAGLGRTGSTLGAALAAVPLASLAASRGRRVALTTGWLVAAAGALVLIAAAQLRNVPLLLVGLAMAGAGTAAQYQARFAATDLAAPAQKARALSRVVWVGSIGLVLGPNLGTPGGWVARHLGLATLGGTFVLTASALATAGLATWWLLRPDPLGLALQRSESLPGPIEPKLERETAAQRAVRFAAAREAWQLARASPTLAVALTAIVTAQTVMVAVMTMAPVHMADEGGSLTVVGLTISLHIVGMYWLAPLAGLVTDRGGATAGIVTGAALFAASFLLAIADASSMWVVAVSLVLLGLGWSFMSVAGAASLSDSIGGSRRTRLQGFADGSANLVAALGAFLGGPLMAAIGYGGLATVAWLAMLPLGFLLVRRRATPGPGRPEPVATG